ncbi:T6SS immunity protein Tdi1 domain-containing protein [Desulfogranum japonicum]|uniref:T6SS immunity protein Tdi1 domain-containing protein n=1 Tax=Desulfogranum japonicum TaxID=231447 RepID=UPI00048CB5E1|nr:T6SS immunity protein Tdi1 domain-containing protein [Desulfogranum japonicum]
MSIIQEIKESWGWVGIDLVEIVGENDFGNLMIRDSQGQYWRLCPEDVYCEVVAKNREELDRLSTDQEFLEDWYMRALVEQTTQHLGPLSEGQKYCLVIPGIIGGEYAISNIKKVSMIELVRFSGDLACQIKGLSDGAQVQLKVVD